MVQRRDVDRFFTLKKWRTEDKESVSRHIEKYNYTGYVFYKNTGTTFRIDRDSQTGLYQLWSCSFIEEKWSGYIVAKMNHDGGTALVISKSANLTSAGHSLVRVRDLEF